MQGKKSKIQEEVTMKKHFRKTASLLVIFSLIFLGFSYSASADGASDFISESTTLRPDVSDDLDNDVRDGLVDSPDTPKLGEADMVREALDLDLLGGTHYYSVGSESFVPGSNVDYWNTYGCGGAYMKSGHGALVAGVNLPHGAVVTGFKVFFNGESRSNLQVYLDRQHLSGCGYGILAAVDSLGISGYGSKTATTISNAFINNTLYSYLVYAYCTDWSSNMQIKGALIAYTVASDFVGTWVNDDPKTEGMTRLIIGQTGNKVTVHGYGKCHPTDCDWGIISVPYTGNPFTAVYEHGFKTNTLTIRLLDTNSLHVHSSNVFHDGTNRDYEADYYMHLEN